MGLRKVNAKATGVTQFATTEFDGEKIPVIRVEFRAKIDGEEAAYWWQGRIGNAEDKAKTRERIAYCGVAPSDWASKELLASALTKNSVTVSIDEDRGFIKYIDPANTAKPMSADRAAEFFAAMAESWDDGFDDEDNNARGADKDGASDAGGQDRF